MKKQNEVRKNALYRFGFGTDAMKGLVVCENCNSLEVSGKLLCRRCGAKLPKTNLYALYRSRHRCCENCGGVLAKSMHYCPRCGVRVWEASALCAL